MKEEDEILKKVGRDNAFKVPENFFENLTSEVMNKLPERESAATDTAVPSKWNRLKPFLYMAAMFVGVALIIRVAVGADPKASDQAAMAPVTELEEDSDSYINTVLDGAMMDDYSLYVYLTDAGAE